MNNRGRKTDLDGLYLHCRLFSLYSVYLNRYVQSPVHWHDHSPFVNSKLSIDSYYYSWHPVSTTTLGTLSKPFSRSIQYNILFLNQILFLQLTVKTASVAPLSGTELNCIFLVFTVLHQTFKNSPTPSVHDLTTNPSVVYPVKSVTVTLIAN